MLTLELDRELEARLLEIARKEHQTPAQIINHMLTLYLSSRQSAELIEQPTRSLDVAKRNRGITVGSQTGHSAARIFGLKDGQGRN